MRLPDRILTAIQDELSHRPSKLGISFFQDYESELSKFEANIRDESRQDFSPYIKTLMDRIQLRGERLERWYDRVVQDREAARRKKDK